MYLQYVHYLQKPRDEEEAPPGVVSVAHKRVVSLATFLFYPPLHPERKKSRRSTSFQQNQSIIQSTCHL